jgi:hypothetical protein
MSTQGSGAAVYRGNDDLVLGEDCDSAVMVGSAVHSCDICSNTLFVRALLTSEGKLLSSAVTCGLIVGNRRKIL